MNANQQAKLNRLIAQKKAEDTVTFLKAQQEGRLLEYLKEDLKLAGLDPAKIRFDATQDPVRPTPSSSSSRRNSPTVGDGLSSFQSYVSLVSSQLDSTLFEPYLRSQKESKDHAALVEKLSSLRSFQKVSQRLETLKVISFALGVLCTLYGLRNLSINPVVGLLYCLVAHDGVRISYNCYIRNYLSVSMNYLMGDLSSLGNTVMQVASSALGLSSRPDPLTVLEHGVYWQAIFHNTVSSSIYAKVSLCNV